MESENLKNLREAMNFGYKKGLNIAIDILALNLAFKKDSRDALAFLLKLRADILKENTGEQKDDESFTEDIQEILDKIIRDSETKPT